MLKTPLVDISPRQLMRAWRNPSVLLKSAENIKKLDVVRREKNLLLTQWEVEIDKVVLSWRQWDTLDLKKGRIDFKLQEGVFSKYEGSWQISRPHKDSVMLELCVNIDWGLPLFEPVALKRLRRVSGIVLRNFVESIKRACIA